ncbi:heavy-metal-associated domain-containing protein (plasmid) [Jeotgalibaca sp. MA1X17-3]|uniref:heavy-metal-associated domain-containing protein n=1 Tax=Jeotgalibaca sp. MA1X17-3 TaxID=2908211 RepID=UPI001F4494E4|nr:heavy metal-associated domain-containing protein [Jeotgalibaca sp. MA1X17-3]UJF16733.1 heavy-metal-associated domain-containing protein [Jeotgalibaca sp. MA1X17-3]
MRTEVRVEGMKCKGCAHTVQEKLEAIEGVNSVEVNLENKKVVVESKSEINKEAFRTALSETNYSVVG